MGKLQSGLSRRRFTAITLKAFAAAAAFLGGCSQALKDPAARPAVCAEASDGEEFDYIVVGSGAGGGPLAANLALNGYSVLLLEAGGDEQGDNYSVPLFHPYASEDPGMRWDFFVRHYTSNEQSRRDPKYSPEQRGVFYPRSGTLGGCTAHNAMIMIYPHDSDWDELATISGDSGWGSKSMRRYYQRLEDCGYVEADGDNDSSPSGHGFSGWLPVNLPGVELLSLRKYRLRLLRDSQLKSLLRAALKQLDPTLDSVLAFLGRLRTVRKTPWILDPNDRRSTQREGLVVVPMTVADGRRRGSREYVRHAERKCRGGLRVQLHSLVTRVLFDGDTATGVEYLQGRDLYRADRKWTAGGSIRRPGTRAQPRQLRASREVILCGGTFNTPQLLMLSGIGPGEELQRHGIPLRVNSPWVGRNLQDRYEVSVVSAMAADFTFLDGASFQSPSVTGKVDPMYEEWTRGEGLYTTNGAVISFVKRSSAAPGEEPADLFVFGMPGYFAGYYPGYSKKTTADKRHFTWAILKGQTRNTAGEIRLRSADPTQPPDINFHYFDEGNDHAGDDLDAVVEAVEFVRGLNEKAKTYIAEEEIPGNDVRSRDQVADFVRDNAWGHHASGSCRMGSEDPADAVLDSRLRVNGVKNLRVVDASVFPRIPGFFIVSAVYMVSERATDLILEDAERRDQQAGTTQTG